MTTETGRVLSVDEQVRGSVLAEDALVGDTSIVVESTDDFEEAGGTLTLGALQYAYGVPDDSTFTIPVPAITVAALEGDPVLIYPQPVARYAQVVLEDAADAPIAALVPHALVGRLAEGLNSDGDLDAVEVIETAAGEWEVRDLLGRRLTRSGMAEMDWRNSKGLTILLGDPGSDIAEAFFTGAEMIAECARTVALTLPQAGSGTIRRLGRAGVGAGADPATITLDFPAKISIQGGLSVINETATDFNARLYLLAVDVSDDSTRAGRQGTNVCQGGDSTATPPKHRQITNQRQVTMFGTPEDPVTYAFYWGLQQDSAIASRAATVRNAKMTLRVSYAPDLPTSDSPERSPLWTPFADTAELYTAIEGNDLG